MRVVVMRALFVCLVFLCGCRESWHDEACRLAPPPPACTCPALPDGTATARAHAPEPAPHKGIGAGGTSVLSLWRDFSAFALGPVRALAQSAPAKQNDAAARGGRGRKSAPSKAIPEGTCIDINRGTVQELMMLPGVGQGRAEAIVAARGKKPFRRRSDITRVRGIGKKTYRRMEPAICPI